MKKCLVFFVCIVPLMLNSSAKGELLNLNMLPYPDIFSGSIDVTYNSDTNTFSASGWTLTLYDGNGPQIDFDEYGQFLISVTIDEAGVASSGSLTLTGKVLGYGTENPLLTGTLTDFGFAFFGTQNPDVNDGLFEFLFSVSGGDLAGLYGGIGAQAGVIFFASVGGDVAKNQFTEDFNTMGSGSTVSDTGTPCIVDFVDLANFCENWLEAGPDIAADLDDSNDVNLADYNIFAGYWREYCPGGWQLK